MRNWILLAAGAALIAAGPAAAATRYRCESDKLARPLVFEFGSDNKSFAVAVGDGPAQAPCDALRELTRITMARAPEAATAVAGERSQCRSSTDADFAMIDWPIHLEIIDITQFLVFDRTAKMLDVLGRGTRSNFRVHIFCTAG